MKELTLPSGMNAKIKDGKGYHLLHAQRKAKYADEIPFAMIAELTEIEGQKLVFEDILDLPLADVMTLIKEVDSSNGNFPSPPASTLSISPEQQAGQSQT